MHLWPWLRQIVLAPESPPRELSDLGLGDWSLSQATQSLDDEAFDYLKRVLSASLNPSIELTRPVNSSAMLPDEKVT